VYLGSKIYRVGGFVSGSSFATNSVDVYNVVSNTWAITGTVQSYPRSIAALGLVSDGTYLYAAGGTDGVGSTTSTYRYDPASNTWDDAAITDLPQFMGRDSASFGVLNGRFVLAGGYAGNLTSSVTALDLSAPTGAWTNLPSM